VTRASDISDPKEQKKKKNYIYMKLNIKTQLEEKTIIILFSSQGTKGYQENFQP
jgi:hypothetical protein